MEHTHNLIIQKRKKNKKIKKKNWSFQNARSEVVASPLHRSCDVYNSKSSIPYPDLLPEQTRHLQLRSDQHVTRNSTTEVVAFPLHRNYGICSLEPAILWLAIINTVSAALIRGDHIPTPKLWHVPVTETCHVPTQIGSQFQLAFSVDVKKKIALHNV